MLLAAGYRVTTLSYPLSTPLPGVEEVFVHSRPGLLAGMARRLLGYAIEWLTVLGLNRWLPLSVWTLRMGARHHTRSLEGIGFDLVVTHDWPLLPLCVKLRASGARVIFDAREYYPKEFEGSAWFRVAKAPERVRVLRHCLGELDGFCTVSDGLAEQFEIDFGHRPHVIYSAPSYVEAAPTQVASLVRMVHHGVANRDRSLERMIDVVRGLDERFTLDMYLTGEPAYIKSLAQRAEGCARIRIQPPVPFEQIARMLKDYDVGVCFFPPQGFNNLHALPNKFFEYVQARLAIAIGPSPDMKVLVERYGLGVVSPSFEAEDMISVLNPLSAEDINAMKQSSHRAAAELCWGVESYKFGRLLGIN